MCFRYLKSNFLSYWLIFLQILFAGQASSIFFICQMIKTIIFFKQAKQLIFNKEH